MSSIRNVKPSSFFIETPHGSESRSSKRAYQSETNFRYRSVKLGAVQEKIFFYGQLVTSNFVSGNIWS